MRLDRCIPDPVPDEGTTRVAARWAALLLVLTVALGGWLRALLALPALGGSAIPRHLLHAHSHVAFFGWLVPGLAAAMLARSTCTAWRGTVLRAHAHLLGVLTLAALASFLRDGYGGASIPLSAAHVALWWALVPLAWALPRAAPVERRLLRAALVFLALAGATTIAPVVLLRRGITDGWARELGIRLFLGTFLHGWVGLGVLGLAAGALERRGRLAQPRTVAVAAVLIAVGTVPATLLHVAAAPPHPAALAAGRVGAALVGAGSLLFATCWLRARLPIAMRLAAWALALTGALALFAAAGVGRHALHARPVVIAFVHLHLLGVATPVLLVALAPSVRGARRAVIAGSGLAVMLAALVSLGWSPAWGAAAWAGLDASSLMLLALLGGGLAAVAVAEWATRAGLHRAAPVTRSPATQPCRAVHVEAVAAGSRA